MMGRLILYVVLIFSCSCSKENTDEYATGNNQIGIVGKWKLVKSTSMNSWGDEVVKDRSSENIIISFDSLGNTTDPKFSCKGKYTFSSKETKGEIKVPNMTRSFGCKNSMTNDEGLEGKYYTVIRDDNYLVMNDVNCVEMCADEYRRLKD